MTVDDGGDGEQGRLLSRLKMNNFEHQVWEKLGE